MKKLSLFILVLVFSALSLFASFNVGLDLGWGFQRINKTYNADTIKYRNNGFSGSLYLGYDFNEDWGIRGKAGLSYYGKTTINGISHDDFKDSGLTFDLALDAVNTISINSSVDFVTFFGLKMVKGNVYKKVDDNTNRSHFALGVNVGCEVAYEIVNNLSLHLGADCAWLFFAKSPYLKGEGSSARVNTFILKPYFGAGYSF